MTHRSAGFLPRLGAFALADLVAFVTLVLPVILYFALKFLPWQLSHTCLFHIPGWPLEVTMIPGWTVAGLTATWVIVAVYVLSLLIRRRTGRPTTVRLALAWCGCEREYAAFRRRLPRPNVMGGCCGTDPRHVEQSAKACAPRFR